jgi:hypothetical protein
MSSWLGGNLQTTGFNLMKASEFDWRDFVPGVASYLAYKRYQSACGK